MIGSVCSDRSGLLPSSGLSGYDSGGGGGGHGQVSFGTCGEHDVSIGRAASVDGFTRRKAAPEGEPAKERDAEAPGLLAQGGWRSEVKTQLGRQRKKATDGLAGADTQHEYAPDKCIRCVSAAR